MKLEDEKIEESVLVPEEESLASGNNFIVLSPPPTAPTEDDSKIRTIGLIGDIDEEKSTDIIYSMLMMKQTSKKEVAIDSEKPELGTKTEIEPFEMLISTYGGSAFEMLGIYDTMRMIKKDCPIATLGVGKVMSAGVLLLAAGTKGMRKIGKNCRVMIHDVKGGAGGDVDDLENEVEEMKWMQDKYIQLLADNSKLTKSGIKKLLKNKVNVYWSAKEAVDNGIADKIF